ncbi:hypothetical protein F5Y18DRAFT_9217 [Xylariaceae sp. FL1019]|nr:hypothetical protein F5Y18DRAFT_9217 [Xylariaceae sp. FL1019]
MAALISDHVGRCLEAFQAPLSDRSPLNDAVRRRFQDEFARFKLWSGNIGAHRKGHSSLDWRLRDASNMKDLVTNLLVDLNQTLHDALSFLDEVGFGQIQLDDEEKDTETLEIAADVGDIVGCLLRLSTSITNPAPHDHFMSSNAIDTSYFEGYDIQHVKSKFSNVDGALASRLGKAISQRRQYFKYRESHRQKLSQGLDNQDFAKSEAGALSTVASSIPLALKDVNTRDLSFARLDEDVVSNSGASRTSYATSGPASGRLKMPQLPEQASQGPFECPYCYMIISINTSIQWKKHVSADLRPYVCLEPDCPTPEQQYTRRHDWLDHMNQKHWQLFKCPYNCQDQEFLSATDLECHIRQLHSQVPSQGDIGTVLDFYKQPRPWPDQVKCPLCEQLLHSKYEYGRHVGRHQTDLALFSLPSISGDSDETDELSENEKVDDEVVYTDEDVDFGDLLQRHSDISSELASRPCRTLNEQNPLDFEEIEAEAQRASDHAVRDSSEGSPKNTEMQSTTAEQDDDHTHEWEELWPRPNSCVRCLARRIKCDTNMPCMACIRTSDECRLPGDFVCSECGNVFDQLHELNHHKRYHEKPHTCHHPGCGKMFNTKTHLDRHARDKHGTGQRTFHCPEQGCAYAVGMKGFSRLDNWRRHMLNKHQRNPESYTSQQLVSVMGRNQLYSIQDILDRADGDQPTTAATAQQMNPPDKPLGLPALDETIHGEEDDRQTDSQATRYANADGGSTEAPSWIIADNHPGGTLAAADEVAEALMSPFVLVTPFRSPAVRSRQRVLSAPSSRVQV